MRKCSSTILYAACTFRPYKSTPVLKLFRTFTGKRTRGLSLRTVFSLLFQDTLFTVGKAECDTRRVPPEHLARPISQVCTGVAVQPAVKVLVPSRAHLQQMLKNFRASRTPRASSRGFHANKSKNI